jgi:hypothetical protein
METLEEPDMPPWSSRDRRGWTTVAALAATMLVLMAQSASSRTTSSDPSLLDPAAMVRGVSMTQAQCATLPTAVWVRAMGRHFCIRYYVSNAGGTGIRPIVFMQGDKRWRYDRRSRSFILPPDSRPIDPASFTRLADAFSRRGGTTAIYLARMGVDGSSGHHVDRHTVLELQVMNAALEAIRRRHGFDGFHLVGQSGGASLIGGLLGLRHDIGCAVPGAGRLARLNTRPPAADPARRLFEPLDGIPAIVRSQARILVVTDPQDVRVPYRHQATFVEELRRAGGRAEHYFIEATDENHHATVPYTLAAVAACVRGATQAEISALLARIVARRLEARARVQERPRSVPPAPPQQRPRPRPAT